VVARKVLVRRHVGAGGRSVGSRCFAHPVGELRPGGRVLPRGRRRLAGGRVASRRGAHGPTSFLLRLARVLARSARSVHLSGRRGVSSWSGGNRA
jgi:hypothetical protein